LKISAGTLVLNRNGFGLLKKSQKNINVNVVVSQMADIDACGTSLRGVVP
jgi:hypothetical protein